MSIVPATINLYIEAFTVGVFYGWVFCISSCLPYVASYIAGVGAGFRRGILLTLTFNSGRVVAYTIIGTIVGLLSGVLKLVVSEETLLPLQEYSAIAFGIITILIGLTILHKTRKSGCDYDPKLDEAISTKALGKRFDFRAFSLGLTRGLVICPPLLLFLIYALPFAAPIDSPFIAFLFGLGTAISPLLLLGGITGWLLNKAPLFRKWIALSGSIMLIVLGLITILTAILAT